MALDRLLLTYDHSGQKVATNAIRGRLHTVVKAGGPAIQDAASITRPDTQIIDASRVISQLDITGTYLSLVLGYDAGLTGITAPVVKLFGRYNNTDRWELLRNMAEDVNALLRPDSSDVSDGTLAYTTVDLTRQVWDVGRVNEVVVGVETALAGTGTVSNSIIQARLWG